MLSLHLLQLCLVYINTLMIQQVLHKPQWQARMHSEDPRALTLLIYSHVTPYGTFRATGLNRPARIVRVLKTADLALIEVDHQFGVTGKASPAPFRHAGTAAGRDYHGEVLRPRAAVDRIA
jgi:hypothetical protein